MPAMEATPRELFLTDHFKAQAYEDATLPIGYQQTLSAPAVVAKMTEALEITDRMKVLEIGTGSGYQAAVLAELAAAVYSIEIVARLAERARDTLAELGYANVQVRHGDGYAGWPEQAPFDAIMVTAAAKRFVVAVSQLVM